MKTINKVFTQDEVYSLAIALNENFRDDQTRLPAMIAFGIQKNKATLLSLAEEIEKSRLDIITHYGTAKEDGNYLIPEESIEDANNEMRDLLTTTQELKIYTCGIEELSNIEFTSAQMNTLMFMIDDEE